MRIANGLRSKKIAWLGTASYIANDLMKQSDFYCYKNNIIHTKTNQELCRKSRQPIRMRPFFPGKDHRLAAHRFAGGIKKTACRVSLPFLSCFMIVFCVL